MTWKMETHTNIMWLNYQAKSTRSWRGIKWSVAGGGIGSPDMDFIPLWASWRMRFSNWLLEGVGSTVPITSYPKNRQLMQNMQLMIMLLPPNFTWQLSRSQYILILEDPLHFVLEDKEKGASFRAILDKACGLLCNFQLKYPSLSSDTWKNL